MANVAFLGLGIMGYPMARNLLRAGHSVALWSNTLEKAKKLASEESNASVHSTPRDAVANADFVFLCVGDTAMSERVILGENGVVEGLKPGAIVADASTISPTVSQAMAKKVAENGASFLDAPCTGSKPGAEKATLTFMVGGKREVFEKTKPVFEAMGKQLYYCGDQGMGLHAKLSQNLLVGNIMQALNESLVLAAKAGVDLELLVDILNNSVAKGMIPFKAPFILRHDFSTNFSTRWMEKDLSLVLESAGELSVPLPITSVTQQIFRATIAKGMGEDDLCGSIRVLEDLANVSVRKE